MKIDFFLFIQLNEVPTGAGGAHSFQQETMATVDTKRYAAHD